MKKPSNPPTIYNSEDGHVTLVLPKIDAFAIVNQYMLPQSQYVLTEKPSNPPTIYNSDDGYVTASFHKWMHAAIVNQCLSKVHSLYIFRWSEGWKDFSS